MSGESFSSTRVENIEKQLAYLQWRKKRNERAIRDKLEATKILKQKDLFMTSTSADRLAWKNNAVAMESSKALSLSDEQISILTTIRERSPGRKTGWETDETL
jgi:hypothetical protein